MRKWYSVILHKFNTGNLHCSFMVWHFIILPQYGAKVVIRHLPCSEKLNRNSLKVKRSSTGKGINSVFLKGNTMVVLWELPNQGYITALKYYAFLELFPSTKTLKRCWWTLPVLLRSQIVQGLKGRTDIIVPIVVRM